MQDWGTSMAPRPQDACGAAAAAAVPLTCHLARKVRCFFSSLPAKSVSQIIILLTEV